jgi:hypothetical protein
VYQDPGELCIRIQGAGGGAVYQDTGREKRGIYQDTESRSRGVYQDPRSYCGGKESVMIQVVEGVFIRIQRVEQEQRDVSRY